ncbi:hypothetical protein J3R30DRAFT_2705992 [Lentinula aciculospora]|uniref:Uncharacterized protein n=1 Tax=Lentinula aciculospora TaxID=153920 RepID=A0A9W9AE87_9AGAR|nr:hypothetical protein J3R30DRAFT_2705992 [Lentinula aciculospora]
MNMAFYNAGYNSPSTLNDDPSPDYHALVRSNSTATGSSNASSASWGTNDDSLSLSSPVAAKQLYTTTRRPSRRTERYQYTYNLIAGSAPLQFQISVEPTNGKPVSGKYLFRLSLKVDKTERPLAEPISLNLTVDPRKLEFIVFVFPGKTTIPAGCSWSYRVWLRANSVDHRIFGDDELWVGKDPDFSSIPDASFARLKTVNANSQLYDGVVGRARVQFIARWTHIAEGLYKYSLEYESAGVGMLFEDFRLILQGDPRSVSFLIYTIPMGSMPAGASHRIRVWLKTFLPFPNDQSSNISLPFNDSYVYQRIWKSDSLKIGVRLDFHSLGAKMIMGYLNGPPKTYTVSQTRDKYEAKGSIELG